MQYKEEDLKLLQKIEIEILAEVIRVCEENGIRYFTVGGTTLGAVRHSGFIPWDDDIDIGMLREDYEKFLAVAPSQLKEGYTLQSFAAEPAMPTYFAKVRKDGTLFVEEYAKDIPMHQGVFLDVMPYDRIPEDPEERERYRKRTDFWEQLYIAKTIKTTSVPHAKHKKIKNAFRALLHGLLHPVSKEWLYRRLDTELRAYNHSDSRLFSTRGQRALECREEDLFPLTAHSFENLTVMLPHNADKVLRTQYGDYMRLPPEDKRYSHRPVELKL